MYDSDLFNIFISALVPTTLLLSANYSCLNTFQWTCLYLRPSFMFSENIWNKQPRTCKSMFRSNWSVCIMDRYSTGSQWSFYWVASLLTAYGWVTGVCCWLLAWHHQQRNGAIGQAAAYWNFSSCSSEFWHSETSWGKIESDLIFKFKSIGFGFIRTRNVSLLHLGFISITSYE